MLILFVAVGIFLLSTTTIKEKHDWPILTLKGRPPHNKKSPRCFDAVGFFMGSFTLKNL